MTNLLLMSTVLSAIISTLVNFIKPWYVSLVKKKYQGAISIALAFTFWLLASFSFDLGMELTIGAKILLWLALGTWGTVWYDTWQVVKSIENRLNNSKKNMVD